MQHGVADQAVFGDTLTTDRCLTQSIARILICARLLSRERTAPSLSPRRRRPSHLQLDRLDLNTHGGVISGT